MYFSKKVSSSSSSLNAYINEEKSPLTTIEVIVAATVLVAISFFPLVKSRTAPYIIFATVVGSAINAVAILVRVFFDLIISLRAITESYTWVSFMIRVICFPHSLSSSSPERFCSLETLFFKALQIVFQPISSQNAGALPRKSPTLSVKLRSSLIISTMVLPIFVSNEPVSLMIAVGQYFLSSSQVSLCRKFCDEKYLGSMIPIALIIAVGC